MDPLFLVEFQGRQNIEAPDYQGEVLVLTVQIPVSRKDNIDRNDTLRREVTAAIASVLPTEPT